MFSNFCTVLYIIFCIFILIFFFEEIPLTRLFDKLDEFDIRRRVAIALTTSLPGTVRILRKLLKC